MPIIDFQAEDGTIYTAFVKLSSPEKDFHEQLVDGKLFKRIYTTFNVAKDTTVNDATKDDFRRATEGKRMTYGDMWEASAEFAEKRKKLNGGRDPIAEKQYAEYKKKKGKDHPEVVQRDGFKKLKEKYGVDIDASRKIEEEI